MHIGPNLEQLRKQAKELLRAARAGDPSGLKRVLSVERRLTLSAAQLAIAREQGFTSWPEAKRALESLDELRTKTQDEHWSPDPPQIGHLMGVVMGDPRTHEEEFFGSVIDELSQSDKELHHHRGMCTHCGARYEFETTIIRGFADFIEAFCPKCKSSLGEFREDVGGAISVRLAETHRKVQSARHAKTRRGGGAMSM